MGGGVEDGLLCRRFITSTLSGSDSPVELFTYLHQGDCSSRRDLGPYCQGSSRTSSSPGFYSRLFLVQMASGSWRPVIDLSHFNKFVCQTRFKMFQDGVQPVSSLVCSEVRLDGLHRLEGRLPSSSDSSRQSQVSSLCGRWTVYQFRALCFSLSTTPQIFTLGHGSGVSHASQPWS